MEKSKSSDKFIRLNLGHVKYKTKATKKFLSKKFYKPKNPKKLTSFSPGTINKIFVKKGDTVKKNDKLLILEAMKMNNYILSPINGVIKKVYVEINDNITKNQLLIDFE